MYISTVLVSLSSRDTLLFSLYAFSLHPFLCFIVTKFTISVWNDKNERCQDSQTSSKLIITYLVNPRILLYHLAYLLITTIKKTKHSNKKKIDSVSYLKGHLISTGVKPYGNTGGLETGVDSARTERDDTKEAQRVGYRVIRVMSQCNYTMNVFVPDILHIVRTKYFINVSILEPMDNFPSRGLEILYSERHPSRPGKREPWTSRFREGVVNRNENYNQTNIKMYTYIKSILTFKRSPVSNTTTCNSRKVLSKTDLINIL